MNTSTSKADKQSDMSYYRGQRREMLEFIPEQAQRFVELGCGAGAFGALLRQARPGCIVSGVEIHPQAACEARSRLDHVIELPVEIALDIIEANSVDCVICNDVLEHLVDPWAVCLQIKRILRQSGTIVASIPNVRHFPVFKKYFLGGDWEYEKWGVLDRTHLRFFTKRSIERLFVETGFHAEQIAGIFPQKLPWKAALLNRLLKGKLNDMQYERYACVAKSLPTISTVT
jgi:SAM-dependent methyltransferase